MCFAIFNLTQQILGLAIYNGNILHVNFAFAVYKKLLGIEPSLADLKEANPVLSASFGTNNDNSHLAILSKNFSIMKEMFLIWRFTSKLRFLIQQDRKAFHWRKTEQRFKLPMRTSKVWNFPWIISFKEYIHTCVRYFLSDLVSSQFQAFATGFYNVCGSEVLKLCRPEELELMICISFHIFQLNLSPRWWYTRTQLYWPRESYEIWRGSESKSSFDPVFPIETNLIHDRAFWEIVHSLEPAEKRQFLVFCTGSDRVPIKGLSTINFMIQKHGPDSER